jgi:DNA-binding transcriptional regulator PaaX
MFDIPEKLKKVRESLRFHFKDMGLIEFQKSIFIHPFPCKKEIEFIIEFYNARKYVRFILAEEVDNELHFKHKFELI